ncbi:acyl carrier protein [Streptomyces sp. NPDC088766]|uniref:acyl carrier protein n=1 Tax=Streptomyces sp. NPDC088766 TaxID=3365893 RepID=UPI0038150388
MSEDGVETRPERQWGEQSGKEHGKESEGVRGKQPADVGAAAKAPVRSVTDQVRSAWAEVLGHDDFDDDTPFTEAGGHSLKATQVLMRLRRRLGVRLPNRLFFDHPTVRELAVAVERIAATQPIA